MSIEIALSPEPDDRRPPARLWDAAFFAAAVLMGVALCPPYFTDWDSFDYTVQAIRGVPSPLASGRIFFTGMLALVYRIGVNGLGVAPEHTWHLLVGWTIFLAGLATVAIFRAAFQLTQSRFAAIVTGVLWLTAPQPMVYAGSIMTETPTMLLFAVAVLLTERAVRNAPGGRSVLPAALAGLAFAAATNMREPLILFGLYFAARIVFAPGWSWGGRAKLAAAFLLAFGAAWAVAFALTAWRWGGLEIYLGKIRTWKNQMAEERVDYPNLVGKNARDILFFAGTVSTIALLWALPAAVRAFRRREQQHIHWMPLALLMLGNAAYLASLLGNHDTSVNPRFTMPLMLPIILLSAAAFAQIVLRRDRRWLVAFVAIGLAAMVLFPVSATIPLPGWLKRYFTGSQDYSLGTALVSLLPESLSRHVPHWLERLVGIWLPFVLCAAAILFLKRVLLRARGARESRAAGAALAGLIGLFIIVAGWPLLNHHFYNNSQCHKQFVKEVMATGALPRDAMLIPSGETPALQYIVWLGLHPGTVLREAPYDRDDVLAEAVRAPGWFIVTSGWNWPDGLDFNGRPGPQRKVGLMDLVDRYQAAGKPVFVYGAPSSWCPGASRKIEWREIKELQESRLIEEIDPKNPPPGDLCRVSTTRPEPSSTFYPLGWRVRIRSGEREPVTFTVPPRP